MIIVGAGRAHAAVPRPRPALRVRDRRASPARVVQFAMCVPGAARASASTCSSRSTGATRASASVLRADAAGDARPRRSSTSTCSSTRSLGIARLRPGAARDRRRVPHLHAARRASSASRSRPSCSRRSAASPRARDLRRPARARSGIGDAPDRAAADPRGGVHCSCSRRRSRGSSTSAASSTRSSTDLVSMALFWFSFSLPFAGVNLLLTRTFFCAPAPVDPDALAGSTRRQHRRHRCALYRPFGHRRPRDRHRRRQRRR